MACIDTQSNSEVNLLSTDKKVLKTQQFKDYKLLLADDKLYPIGNSLDRHTIPYSYRAKMVDWMIEVTLLFNLNSQTFFLAQRIMDRYFLMKATLLQPQELHEIGITCLFMASKFEDVAPLFLNIVSKKMAHGNMRKSAIIARELDILTTLDFKIYCATPLDILDSITKDFELSSIVYSKAQMILVVLPIYYKFMCLTPSKQAAISVALALISANQESKIADIFVALQFNQVDLVNYVFRKLRKFE